MTALYDIVIRGARVVDGSGGAPFEADIAINGNRIAAVATSIQEAGFKTIDARGLAVCPGFIDIKTHSDFTLPINPRAESKIRQGVTTEIVGHCGFSVAPCLPGKVALLRDYLSPSAPWLPFRERSFREYLDTFPAAAVNAGMLVGHNTLRLMVMGMENRTPTPEEMQRMIDLLEEALDAGALGMSSGLFTAPGAYAGRDEMVMLCKVLERYKGAYFTHIRDESNKVLEAVDEAIDIADTCGIHVQIVHFKCSGADNWGKAAIALGKIEAAKARGLEIDCDAYPYTAGSNPLKNLLPQWVQTGGVEAMLARLPLAETRRRIREDIARDGLNNWGRIPSWDCVQISISPHLPQYAGRTIAQIASEREQDPIDALCEYLEQDRGATRVLVTSISEQDVEEIMKSPFALVGSDGNCVAPYGVVGHGMPHPRFYGTFARVIGRYVAERKLLPLEAAIRKMTGASAQALNLKDRGLLKPGYRADVTLFDPDNFLDRATYSEPHQYPTGERTTVIVNGTLVLESAEHTGATPGRVLTRGANG